MLQSLAIENFAIIEQVTIDFASGMTVLSGETGAGKSIIIDALGILCGGRGSSELIRHGSERLSVEGLFAFNHPQVALETALHDFGISYHAQEDDLILRREITAQGKNIIRINGQLANVSLLKKIGTFLVDIHGQNEHQALLDATQHLALLDAFSSREISEVLSQYQTAYRTFRQLRSDWQHAQQNEQDQLQQLSFLEFQLNEIEQAHLTVGEDEELEAMSQRLQNAHAIQQNVEAANYLLSDSDTNILKQLKQVSQLLQTIEMYHPPLQTALQQIESMQFDLQEIAHQVAMVGGEFDEDPQTIDTIEARLSELGQLKRKYGMTLTDLLAHYQNISEEVYQIKHREQYLAKLEQNVQAAYQQAHQLAEQLHQLRQQSAQSLIRAIETELADLYMANSCFDVQFNLPLPDKKLAPLISQAVQLTDIGFDQVEFYVATNVGETLKPLVKVASGGELSRFMLALKSVFSTAALAKTMVFDEIDTGVSGRVAQAIAEKMAQIAKRHQVLCITHLAQVAAIAHEQLYIEKVVANERTHTQVTTLDLARRSEVIAQMMSGKVVSETSLQLAKELLKELQS